MASVLQRQASFITSALCFAFLDRPEHYLIASSSISKVKVAFGGMLGGLPLAP